MTPQEFHALPMREQIEIAACNELDGDTIDTLVMLFEKQKPETQRVPQVRFAKWFEDMPLGEVVAITEGLK